MTDWEKLINENYIKKKQVKVSTLFEMIDLELENTFQSGAIEGHAGKRLSTKGKKKLGGDPFDEDPPTSRSKSAPAGFGVLESATGVPDDVAKFLELLKNNGYPNAEFKKIVAGRAVITKLGSESQRRAITSVLDDAGIGWEYTSPGTQKEYKKIKIGDRVFELEQGGGAKMEPNRGEVAEALLALAITKRFMNLPSSSAGAVSATEILEFLTNEVELQDIPQGKKPPKKKLFFQGQITGPSGATDTIRMEVVLRGFSMEGLMPEEGVVGNFIKNDRKIKSYLNGAADYANREVVDFAIGTFDAPDEIPESRKIGWYINDFDNNIFVGAIGTGDQKGTKVDLKMTCTKASECPLDTFNPVRRGTDSDGNPADIRVEPEDTTRRKSLSLKAGETRHIGQQGARFAEGALGLMESLFGSPLANKVKWSKEYNYHAQFIAESGTPEQQEDGSYKFIIRRSRSKNSPHLYARKFDNPSEDEVFTAEEISVKKAESRQKHEGMLKEMVRSYLEVAQAALRGKGTPSDAAFIEKLSDGIKEQAVLKEEGVDLVQFTDKDDYDILNFYEVARVLGELDADLYATITSAGDDNPPYLTIYNSAIVPEVRYRSKEKPSKTISKADYEKKTGKRSFDPSAWEEYQPDSADANTLVRIRPLLRTGAPLIRVEKGDLLKKRIRREKGKIKLYTNGKVVTLDDPEEK